MELGISSVEFTKAFDLIIMATHNKRMHVLNKHSECIWKPSFGSDEISALQHG